VRGEWVDHRGEFDHFRSSSCWITTTTTSARHFAAAAAAGRPFHVDVVCEVTITVCRQTRVTARWAELPVESIHLRPNETRHNSRLVAARQRLQSPVSYPQCLGPATKTNRSLSRSLGLMTHIQSYILFTLCLSTTEQTDSPSSLLPKKINANEEEITGRPGEVFTLRAQSFLFAPSSTSPAASVRQVREK
jgi:hypothetical protein